MLTTADQIRQRAALYVREARRAGQRSLTIQAGQIVSDLNLINRTPAVCSALAGKKFQEENGLVLELVEGPKSGMSTTSRYTYKLEAADTPENSLLALKGIGKSLFPTPGGWAADALAERQAWKDR